MIGLVGCVGEGVSHASRSAFSRQVEMTGGLVEQYGYDDGVGSCFGVCMGEVVGLVGSEGEGGSRRASSSYRQTGRKDGWVGRT